MFTLRNLFLLLFCVALVCAFANATLADPPISGIKTQPSSHQQAVGFDPIAMDSVVFDTTGGATPGVAWKNGLYHVSGSYMSFGGVGAQGYARLLVNGSAVEQFQFDQQNNVWDSQTFSTYLQLNANDTVQLQVDSSGSYNAHLGDYSNFNMFVFNEINPVPEPSTALAFALGVALLGLVQGWRRILLLSHYYYYLTE